MIQYKYFNVNAPMQMPRFNAKGQCKYQGSMLRDNALEDDDEMNAVEYAIILDAYMDVVKLLQKASQRVMKRENMKNQSS